MNKLITAVLIFAAAIMASAGTIKAETASSQTPITQCENIPYEYQIEVFTREDTKSVCREMLKVLEGVTLEDLRMFQKTAFLFSINGYEEHNYKSITAELVDIIRLRGLYNQRNRWEDTINLAWKPFSAFSGAITPRYIEYFLINAGPSAKALSDRGLSMMLIASMEVHKRG
jgi:hypothetical protein